MASSELQALQKHVHDYDVAFIVRNKDYDQYTTQDHMGAIAYRLLCSAAIESYVEDRCKAVARDAASRLTTGKKSASARSMLAWYLMSKRPWKFQAPIHQDDVLNYAVEMPTALKAYLAYVKASHGINGTDLRNLVMILGVRDAQLDERLVDSLNVLADARNPASHSYQNRAKSMQEPAHETVIVEQILQDLLKLDTDLASVCADFPVDTLV
jgi:hypothetical protein